MPRLLFAPAFVLACGLFAADAGAQDKTDPKDKKVEVDPKSNLKDKIFGRWKIVSAPGFDEKQAKQLEMLKLYAFMEFKPDGTMTIGAGSDDPAMRKLIEDNPQAKAVSCKYRLLAGDQVEFFELPKELQQGGAFGKGKDSAKTTIKIEKDDLTMTDDDGKTGKLVRVKETKDKDKPEKK